MVYWYNGISTEKLFEYWEGIGLLVVHLYNGISTKQMPPNTSVLNKLLHSFVTSYYCSPLQKMRQTFHAKEGRFSRKTSNLFSWHSPTIMCVFTFCTPQFMGKRGKSRSYNFVLFLTGIITLCAHKLNSGKSDQQLGGVFHFLLSCVVG